MGQHIELWGRVPAANMTTNRTLLYWKVNTAGLVDIVSLELMNESATVNAQNEIELKEATDTTGFAGTTATYALLAPHNGTLPFQGSTYLCNLSANPATYGQGNLPIAGPTLGGLRKFYAPEERFSCIANTAYGIVLVTAPATTYDAIIRAVFDIKAS